MLTYAYWRGGIAEEVADALCERAGAGVDCNVIIDAMGGVQMERDVLARMIDGGVRVSRFRPPKPYAWRRLSNRTHRKILVADGRVGLTGGVGIAEEWTGDAQDPDHWRDTHVRVRGPIVRGLFGAFAENWLEATGEVLVGEGYTPELEEDRRRRPDAARALERGRRRHQRRGALLPRDRRGARVARPHRCLLRAAPGVLRGARGGRAARGASARARARRAHRQGPRPGRGPRELRPARRGRRRALRVRARRCCTRSRSCSTACGRRSARSTSTTARSSSTTRRRCACSRASSPGS